MAFITRALFGSTHELSNSELVKKLCERVSSARLLQDRLDAFANLKIAAQNLKEEVGNTAMAMLCACFLDTTQPKEISILVLDIFRTLLVIDVTENGNVETPVSVVMAFTDSFLQTSLLDRVNTLLQDADYKVRMNAILLLSTAFQNRTRRSCVLALENTSIVSSLVSVMSDHYEAIRNEAIICLTTLSRQCQSIAQIIAFENGFDKLLEIIDKEGGLDSGVITSDCINLLSTLIEKNHKCKKLFVQGPLINSVASILKQFTSMDLLTVSDAAQSNTIRLLNMISSLSSMFSDSADYRLSNPNSIDLISSGMIESISDIAFAKSLSEKLKLEALTTLTCLMDQSSLLQKHILQLELDISLSQKESRFKLAVEALSVLKTCGSYSISAKLVNVYFLCKLAKTKRFNTFLDFTDLVDNWMNEIGPVCGQFCIYLLLSSMVDYPVDRSCYFGRSLIECPTTSRLYAKCKEKYSAERSFLLIGWLTFVLHVLASNKELVTKFLASGLVNDVASEFVECDLSDFNCLTDFDTGRVFDDTTDKVLSVESEELRAITQYLCAFIIGICISEADERYRSALNTYVDTQIGVGRCLHKISHFVDDPAFKLDFTSRHSLTVIQCIRSRHLVLDSTVRLLHSLRGSIIRRVCYFFNLDSSNWLTLNIFSPRNCIDGKDAAINTEEDYTQLVDAVAQKNNEIAKLQLNIQELQSQNQQWYQAYNNLVLQQRNCTNQIEQFRAENQRLNSQIMNRPYTSTQPNIAIYNPVVSQGNSTHSPNVNEQLRR